MASDPQWPIELRTRREGKGSRFQLHVIVDGRVEYTDRVRLFDQRDRQRVVGILVERFGGVSRKEFEARLEQLAADEAQFEHDQTASRERGPDDRVVIHYDGNRLASVLDEVTEALSDRAGVGLHQRHCQLVRIANTEEPQIIAVSPHAVMDVFSRHINFKAEKDGALLPIKCPQDLAKAYRERAGDWNLPVLRGVRTAPTLVDGGRVLQKSGLDPETGIYLDCRSQYPAIQAEPSEGDAITTLQRLMAPLVEFPFVSEAHRATALAGVLTAVSRPSYPHAPLFAVSAPKAATGKSACADLAGIIATGKAIPAMSWATSKEENEKALFARLCQGAALGLIDNVEGPLRSPMLCSILTQREVEGRVLGESRMVTVPSMATWFATGNNLAIGGDLDRRTLRIELDANAERPETRRFKSNLYDEAARHHPLLLASALTMLRAHAVAGYPGAVGLPPLNGFDGWSRVVRGAIVWLGLPDPVETRLLDVEHDVEVEGATIFLAAWHSIRGEEPALIREVVELLEAGRTSPDSRHPSPHHKDLQVAYRQWSDDCRDANPNRLGRRLASVRNTPLGGYRLEHAGPRTREGRRWRVVRLAPTPSTEPAAEASRVVGVVGVDGVDDSLPNAKKEISEKETERVGPGFVGTIDTDVTDTPSSATCPAEEMERRRRGDAA